MVNAIFNYTVNDVFMHFKLCFMDKNQVRESSNIARSIHEKSLIQ